MSNANGDGATPTSDGWRQHLRQGLDDDLVEVRYAVSGGDVHFLLVHRPGARYEAIARFLDVVRGDDLPPFEVITIEAARLETRAGEFRDYVGV